MKEPHPKQPYILIKRAPSTLEKALCLVERVLYMHGPRMCVSCSEEIGGKEAADTLIGSATFDLDQSLAPPAAIRSAYPSCMSQMCVYGVVWVCGMCATD